MALPYPQNPLESYVQAPSPLWDFTDSHTYYDGLWGQGLWPPEGIRGLGQFTNEWRPFFSGDRGRLLTASAWGMAGLGVAPTPPITCDDQTGVCTDAAGNTITYDAAGNATVGPQPAVGSDLPCFAGPVGPIQPGRVY